MLVIWNRYDPTSYTASPFRVQGQFNNLVIRALRYCSFIYNRIIPLHCDWFTCRERLLIGIMSSSSFHISVHNSVVNKVKWDHGDFQHTCMLVLTFNVSKFYCYGIVVLTPICWTFFVLQYIEMTVKFGVQFLFCIIPWCVYITLAIVHSHKTHSSFI